MHALVIESGFQLSLHSKCYHQIAFTKHIVKTEYLPLYERLIWDKKYCYYKLNIHYQVYLFNNIIYFNKFIS